MRAHVNATLCCYIAPVSCVVAAADAATNGDDDYVDAAEANMHRVTALFRAY